MYFLHPVQYCRESSIHPGPRRKAADENVAFLFSLVAVNIDVSFLYSREIYDTRVDPDE